MSDSPNRKAITTPNLPAVPQPTCPWCKDDPLVFNILDALLPGQMMLRQMFCSNCRSLLAIFPIHFVEPETPKIMPPGGRLHA